MRTIYLIISLAILSISCRQQYQSPRETIDFNFDWRFHLGDMEDPDDPKHVWENIRLPHDWSIIESYQQENTAASTGFVPGGIGWYRKSFSLSESDRNKLIWIEFDGVYRNSDVRINGHHLGFRPNGYSSFSYDLARYLNFGNETNIITVRVDHSAYADSRWYTGSGIYRNVRLVKTHPIHIPQWGVRIVTPEVSRSSATVNIKAMVEGTDDETTVEVQITKNDKELVASVLASFNGRQFEADLEVPDPSLWGIEDPALYKAVTIVRQNGETVDKKETTFGIRTFSFDASHGFALNGESIKIKGVNLHHDAGAVGAAVPKAIWEYRIRKLKSIGVNAIRMSHNPHSVELMDVCDETGMLVMDEFFDEWQMPKAKSIVWVGDGKAIHIPEASSYSEYFLEWAERDLKDLIRRDFNHPSVIMWSIGNEIELSFPYYVKTYNKINPDLRPLDVPVMDSAKILPVFREFSGGVDSMQIMARQLSRWVKEEDTTRLITCGSARSSVSLATGYSEVVDVFGMNYQAYCYDIVHDLYPDLNLIGSENWGTYYEWKNARDRDFVSGIFVWTGFAYLGEAGPWPRKGLQISFFDFAGFKTPRGYFFECLWKDDPKVYIVTTPASDSEFSYSAEDGWEFEQRLVPPTGWLRRWEWYSVNEHWNYKNSEPIVVQAYTNCEEAELFLNGESLGKQSLDDFQEDNIIKWLVPYSTGELRVKGYNNGMVEDEYSLNTSGKFTRMELTADRSTLKPDRHDIAHVSVQLYDDSGRPVRDRDVPITFKLEGKAELLAVDNGWEMNVDSHYQNSVNTHNGRAMAIIRSSGEKGQTILKAFTGDIESNSMTITTR